MSREEIKRDIFGMSDVERAIRNRFKHDRPSHVEPQLVEFLLSELTYLRELPLKLEHEKWAYERHEKLKKQDAEDRAFYNELKRKADLE